MIVRERHVVEVTPETAAGDPYPVIPIEVPEGAAEVRVQYRTDDDDARIDIGLVDSKGAGPGLPGFRGWSGSARDSVLIRASGATPGYLSGTIEPGRWGVLLGLYQVPRACRIEVTVEVSEGESPDEPDHGPRTVTDARDGEPKKTQTVAGMMPGDLHTHTVHSGDARRPISLTVMIATAERLGLGFLAVTDHNTVSHHDPLAALQAETAVRLVPGQEVTSYRGHFNAWGVLGRIVDFRICDDDDLAWAVAAVGEAGGIASINHPKTVGPAWELGVPEGILAVEAWGAPWLWANGESLAFWDALLRRGRRLVAVGGSDIHDFTARRGHGLATPTTWVPLADDPLAAIRAGHVVISQDPSGPLVLPLSPEDEPLLGEEAPLGLPVRARVVGGAGARLRAVAPAGVVAEVDVNDDETVLELCPLPEGWMRLELWGPGVVRAGPIAGRVGTLWALANPVYSA